MIDKTYCLQPHSWPYASRLPSGPADVREQTPPAFARMAQGRTGQELTR
jgi:hypothetical protein